MAVAEWMRRAFGGHRDEYLREISERAANIREIQGTRGYTAIVGELDRELAWARRELERVALDDFVRLQEYVRALNLVRGYILSAPRRGEGADAVLAERIEKARQLSVEEYHAIVFGR